MFAALDLASGQLFYRFRDRKRREVQRRLSLPPPVVVPYPQMIHLGGHHLRRVATPASVAESHDAIRSPVFPCTRPQPIVQPTSNNDTGHGMWRVEISLVRLDQCVGDLWSYV